MQTDRTKEALSLGCLMITVLVTNAAALYFLAPSRLSRKRARPRAGAVSAVADGSRRLLSAGRGRRAVAPELQEVVGRGNQAPFGPAGGHAPS